MKPAIEIPGYRKVYKALLTFGEDGATATEIERIVPGTVFNTIQNRLKTLVAQGYAKRGTPTADRERMGLKGRDTVDVFIAIQRADG